MEKIYAGLILSAGYSSRMGEMKALLPLGGETFIGRQIRSFRSAGVNDIYVVLGHKAEEIARALSGSSVKTVYNERYSNGMFTSVQAGARAIGQGTCDGIFLLPVDYALAQPFTLGVLAGKFEQGDAKILYPCFHGRKGHPPLFSSSLIGEILESPLEGGLKGVFERYKAQAEYIDMGNATCLIDVDSKQDYVEALDYIEKHTAPDAEECEYIYRYYGVPERVIAHCGKVARIAKTVTEALKDKGHDVDPELVFYSGLVHDIRKGVRDHAGQGARALLSMGYPKAAELTANHMDIGAEYASRLCNESILYFADKITEQTDIVDIKQRMLLLSSKYAGDDERRLHALRRLETAESIRKMIENALGADIMQLIARAEEQA